MAPKKKKSNKRGITIALIIIVVLVIMARPIINALYPNAKEAILNIKAGLQKNSMPWNKLNVKRSLEYVRDKPNSIRGMYARKINFNPSMAMFHAFILGL